MSEYIKWLQILSTEEGVEKYREVIGCWDSLTRVVNKDLKSTLDENISAGYEEQSKDENEKLESQKIELRSKKRKLKSEIEELMIKIKEQSDKETEKKLTLEAEKLCLDYLIAILEKFNNGFELSESELKFIEDRDVDETKENIKKIEGEFVGIEGEFVGIEGEIDEIEEEINEIDNKIKIINLRKILRGKKGVNAMGAAKLFDVIYSKVKRGKFKIEYGRENKQVNGIDRRVIVKPGNVEAFLNEIEEIRGVKFLQEKTIISLQKVADNIYKVLKPQPRSWVNDCYD